MAATPILDLSTTASRPHVRIDGETYELRGKTDLSLADYSTLQRLLPRLGSLLVKSDGPTGLTRGDNKELDELLEQGCTLAFLGASSVLKRVQQVDRILLFRAFFEPLAPHLQRLMQGGRQEIARSSGTRRSRGSNGSTGAATKAGARSR